MAITHIARKSMCALLVCLTVWVVFPVMSHAEDAAPAVAATQPATDAGAGPATPATPAASTKPKVPVGMVNMILEASGFFGFVIIFLSVVVVFLSIQNYMDTRPEKLMQAEVLEELEQMLEEGNYEGALEVCQQEESFMTRIIGAGLGKMAYGFGRMEEAIAEEAETQATILHQKIGYINVIATTAPMLGLLGTVGGMIEAFGMIATNPTANPSDLAAGIYKALMTTMEGLCVAIPGTIIFTFLRNRVVKVIMDQGVVNGEILDRFRNVE